VTVNVTNFTNVPVTIPKGKRLVVQNVSLAGAAQTTGAYVQPYVVLYSSINSATSIPRYFGPNPSVTTPGQYTANVPTTIYADSLSVGPAFAGYTPTFLEFNVVITGYLVDLPK
jgi:hypothetical protein